MTNHQQKLLLLVFLSGGSLMVIEVAATRLLTPFFGASLFVWTSSISVVLAALAYGYFWGAKLSQGDNILLTLKKHLAKVSILTAAIPYIIWLIGLILPKVYLGNTPPIFLLLFTFIIALISLLPAGIFFGTISPLVIEELGRKGHHPGTVSGQVFAMSTIGSILGTIVTAGLFIPYIGTHITFISVATLMLLSCVLVETNKRWMYIALAAALFIAGIILRYDPLHGKNVIYSTESAYQSIRVVDYQDYYGLVYNSGFGTQSIYPKNGTTTEAYWDWLGLMPFVRNEENQKAAIIGFAGGTVANIWRNGPASSKVGDIDGVELDGKVIDISKRFFDSDNHRVNIIQQDGRQFLRQTQSTYDLMVIDLYANEFQIPFHTTTIEFFDLVNQHLSDDGIMAMNVALGVEDSELSQRLINTITSVFPFVYTFQASGTSSMLVVASRTDMNIKDRLPELTRQAGLKDNPNFVIKQRSHSPKIKIFTDDLAPIESLSERALLTI